MNIDFNDAVHTSAEREGLLWLGERTKWLDVKVSRNSSREFDLTIQGTYDGDTGKEYDMSKVVRTKTKFGETVTGMRVYDRGFPKVQPQLFSALFMLACLREFWGMGLIAAPFGDWSFIRDRDEDENWKVFYHVLEQQRLKQSMRPMFSDRFLDACRDVWQGIQEESLEVGSNDEAIELILDADRLTIFGHPEADAELKQLDERFGFQKVQAELARVLRLV